MGVSLFVPAYNEEKILEAHINKIHNFLSEHFSEFELFIIDDNSKDATSKVGKKLSKLKNTKYVRFANGPSRRENLGKAMRQARHDVVAYMDLDLAVPLEYFLKIVDAVKHGADIATGSRNIPGASIKRSIYRWLWSRAYHTTLHIFFNSKVSDYQCGFKAFKKEVLFKLLDVIGYDYSFKRGWFWDAELMLIAEKQNYKIKEIPVKWVAGRQSSFKLGRELHIIPYMLKLRLKMFKKY